MYMIDSNIQKLLERDQSGHSIGQTIVLDSPEWLSFQDHATIFTDTITPDPEKLAIKKDLLSKLSDEAREVLDIIINTPSEIMEELCSSKTGKVTKAKFQNYYRKALTIKLSKLRHQYTRRKFPTTQQVMNKSFKEINEFVKNL